MSLRIILGPMFAGKSSELLGTIRKYSAIGWPIFVITHSSDTRYSEKPEIVSHDKERHPALALRYLDTVLTTLAYICLLYTSPSPRDRQKTRMPSSA